MTDELEEMRTRHNNVEPPKGFYVSLRDGQQAHTDRATLLRALDEAQARAERAEEALRPFAELSAMLPNWTDGTLINVTVYHVGAPTTVKGAIRIRDLRRARAALSPSRADGEGR